MPGAGGSKKCLELEEDISGKDHGEEPQGWGQRQLLVHTELGGKRRLGTPEIPLDPVSPGSNSPLNAVGSVPCLVIIMDSKKNFSIRKP